MHFLKFICFQLGDGDFKRSRSWRKKFKKERGRDRRDHPTLTRRGSTESDISQQSGSSGSENLNSPAHRNKKSPLVGKEFTPVHLKSFTKLHEPCFNRVKFPAYITRDFTRISGLLLL